MTAITGINWSEFVILEDQLLLETEKLYKAKKFIHRYSFNEYTVVSIMPGINFCGFIVKITVSRIHELEANNSSYEYMFLEIALQ